MSDDKRFVSGGVIASPVRVDFDPKQEVFILLGDVEKYGWDVAYERAREWHERLFQRGAGWSERETR
jgi:hypothetical protein